MNTKIFGSIIESIETKLKLASSREFLRDLETVGHRMIVALKRGNKILMAGNGGSAADAQHFAAELAGKFVHERQGLPAIALTTNSSIVTAIGNDFGYKYVFSRQVEGLGQSGDMLVGISTSGNSENIIQAMATAKKMGIITVGLLGHTGGRLKDFCHWNLIVPSANTQHIQEAHILIIHQWCALIDEAFKDRK